MSRVRAYFSSRIRDMKNGVKVIEFVIWWLVFLVMFLGAIDCSTSVTGGHMELQMWANTALLFAIPIFKLLPPKYIVFARLSMHTETAAAIMIFLTSYLGCYKSLYYSHRPYDAIIHLLGAIVCTYAGYELLCVIKKDRTGISPLSASFAGFGISCFVTLAWEVYEFFFDWFCNDVTQHWDEVPSDFLNSIHQINPGSYALFDTMTDITAGVIGAIIGGVAIRIVLEMINAKKHKAEEQTSLFNVA